MHRHLPSRWTWLKQRPFPLLKFCCLEGHQYYGLLRLLIRLPPGLHLFGLYHSLRGLWACDRMSPLLFHHLLSQHPILPTPEGSWRLHFQLLHRFHGLRCIMSSSAPSCPVSGSSYRRCKIHFMLRAVDSLPLLRELHRFSASEHLEKYTSRYP